MRETRILVVACGALAREIVALTKRNGWVGVDVQCLPPELHNRPARIPEAVRREIASARGRYDRIFVAYADCGIGGLLDAMLREEHVERLPGAHCYDFFATRSAFAALAEEEPGTFYLTDFLVRHFERLVIAGLGIDRHPELVEEYFRNYRRVVYLVQAHDAELVEAARGIARRFGLEYQERYTGYGELEASLWSWTGSADSVVDPRKAEPLRWRR